MSVIYCNFFDTMVFFGAMLYQRSKLVIFDGKYDNKVLWSSENIIDFIVNDTTAIAGTLTMNQLKHFIPEIIKNKKHNIIE